MTPPRTKLLNVEKLSVHLGKRQVVEDLSFDLDAGECVGLIGPNGSGKSTLMKALMGLLPSKGAARIGGHDLFAIAGQERARRIAYLPQEQQVVWPISVEALVMLGRAPYRSGFAPPSPDDVAAVEEAIVAMDLVELRHRSARELSGGERARVLIARTLAQQTPLLFADEPTAGLDPAHQIALMETFCAMANNGRTVLACLHDLALAAQWCDRLLLLDEGRILAAGAPLDVLTPENLSTVYGVSAFFADSDHGPVVVPVRRYRDNRV
ncbi:MAG: ABC transporter ATP-binding protein [Filomicrobium sp.]